MKRVKLILAVALVALFAFFALASSDSESESQGTGSAGNADSIGKYSVVIDSCRLAKDYEGKDVVIVKYVFRNVSDDEPASFAWTFSDAAFQNGVGLNEAYVLDDSADYNSDNQTKEIKKGASIEVEVAYELNDTTTDVEVEVEESISFEDKKITKTFKISQ